MVRIPLSFHLNILAGIIVLFNHFAASETGDNALNKVTGAAGRFYVLFRDTALTIQHGCASSLESALCGSAMDKVFPHDAVAYLKVRYCHPPAQESESEYATSSNRGYGGSDFALVYLQPHAGPLVPWTSAENSFVWSPFSLDWWSHQGRLARAVWNRTSDAMVAVGALLVRTCASWWWFRAPLEMTGLLLAASSAVSALGYLFGASVVMGWITQTYVAVVVDFLGCIQWEAQRQVLDVGVVMMERVHGVLLKGRGSSEVVF